MGECFFWYRPIRVVLDQRPLNGRCCRCIEILSPLGKSDHAILNIKCQSVLHNSLLHLLLKNGDFLNTDISQGSVATRLGCGEVFAYEFLLQISY